MIRSHAHDAIGSCARRILPHGRPGGNGELCAERPGGLAGLARVPRARAVGGGCRRDAGANAGCGRAARGVRCAPPSAVGCAASDPATGGANRAPSTICRAVGVSPGRHPEGRPVSAGASRRIAGEAGPPPRLGGQLRALNTLKPGAVVRRGLDRERRSPLPGTGVPAPRCREDRKARPVRAGRLLRAQGLSSGRRRWYARGPGAVFESRVPAHRPYNDSVQGGAA